jgi:hypothetical protein
MGEPHATQFGSNFKTDGVELSVRLRSAYEKTTRLRTKFKTYLNTDNLKLTGKTTGIIIPSINRAIAFDENGGTGSMSIVGCKVYTS